MCKNVSRSNDALCVQSHGEREREREHAGECVCASVADDEGLRRLFVTVLYLRVIYL